jgi:hypothetical protein
MRSVGGRCLRTLQSVGACNRLVARGHTRCCGLFAGLASKVPVGANCLNCCVIFIAYTQLTYVDVGCIMQPDGRRLDTPSVYFGNNLGGKKITSGL